ncbi:MAG: hypothetical protein JWO87_2471 [Phycisphaerales bacterium]|nr:hypothetical protein [Phycisphaerales bacterium]
MSIETAVWFPYWYELDQSISVGQVADFDFFKDPPGNVAHDGRRVFYHGNWQEKYRHLFEKRRLRILGIRHPTLGPIQSIDTFGMDYTFTMTDGRVRKVEAEGKPGSVYDHPEPIADWRIYVEVEPA